MTPRRVKSSLKRCSSTTFLAKAIRPCKVSPGKTVEEEVAASAELVATSAEVVVIGRVGIFVEVVDDTLNMEEVDCDFDFEKKQGKHRLIKFVSHWQEREEDREMIDDFV